MRVRPKKNVEVPTKVKDFVDRAIAASPHDLPDVLEGFKWIYEKGDFYHWLSLFNRFDETLESILKDRKDVSLDGVPEPHATPFPSRSVLSILRVSTTILENCSNKHLYQSHEHLTSLLAAPDKEVVEAALVTLVAFLRKTHGSSVRWHGSSDLNTRLLALSQGWGVKELGIDLAACTNSDESAVQHALQAGSRLHYEFYEEQDGGETAGGVRVIDLKRVDKYAESEHEILFQLVKQFNVPEKLRFQLLARISAARSFATLRGRRHTAAVRLLALHALFLCNPSPEALTEFYAAEPDFVQDLVALLLAGNAVPEQLRTLVLRILAVQLIDRQRSTSVISAISSGGQSGLLSMLLHRAISSVAENNGQADGGFSTQFVEALLGLVSALSSSSSGCNALAEAGIVPALLPLIEDRNPEHVGLLGSAVRILEAFMDFSPPAATVFREIGGLSSMIDRLKVEVQAAPVASSTGADASAEAMQTDVAGSSSAAAASSPAGEGASSSSKSIPYNRRVLLKGLLRTIAISSYAPGSTVRPQEEDRDTMYACLRAIFERATEFGGGLFALAASVMADLTHHDPLCFPGLDAAGLPEAFIKTIKAGVLPSGEAVCCVPTTLVALCLNQKGLKRVEESRALECLIPIFTTPTYLRALQFQGELPSVLGGNLDELMRHVGSLRSQVLDVVMKIYSTLCELGSSSPTPAQEACSQETSSQQEAASAEIGAQPMDTEDVTSKNAAAGTSSEAASAEKPADYHAYLSECIMHSARLLESLSSNADFSSKFVDQGGLQLLLRLYTLRHLPATFGSSAAAHALVAAVRVLNQSAASSVTNSKVVEALTGQLRTTLLLGMSIGNQGVNQLEAGRRDEYTRNVSSLEGLTSLTAAVSRTSLVMLTEMSRPAKFPGLLNVKLDEPVPPHALQVENTTPASAVIARLGDLQRIVLLQLALSGTGKSESDSSAAEKKDDKMEPERDAAELADATDLELQDAGPMLPEAIAEALAAEVAAEVAEVSKSPGASVPNGKKKKSGEELAREVLAHFEMTVRSFYASLAKAIHQHPRRRGDESMPVSGPMRSCALYLGLVMKSSFEKLTLRDAPEAASKGKGKAPEASEQAAQDMSAWRLRYALMLTDSLSSILFDARRNTCHCLLLNYWVRCGGLEAFIAGFKDVAAYLWQAVSKMEALSASGSDAMDTDDQRKPEEAPLKAAKQEVEKAEATLSTMLVLMANLAESTIMQSSPSSGHLLTIPLNEEDQETNAAWKTAESFLDSVKATVLDAVLPVWSNPHMAATSVAGSGIVTHILKKCTEETKPLPAAPSRAQQRAEMTPDPAIVQQCVEMGFSEARVQEALRRVGHNSVELAMEWLFTHPEDPSVSAAPAPAAAEPAKDVAQQLKLAPAQEIVKPQRHAPSTEQLVSGAVAVLEKVPIAAFSLTDLLLSHCAQKPERGEAVMACLLDRLAPTGDSSAATEPAEGTLLATAHLLAVLCDASAPMRIAGVRKGMVSRALDIMEAWVKACPKQGLKGIVPEKPLQPVPQWMDALLLLVNSCTAILWKQPAPDGPADKFKATEPEAAAQQADTVMATEQGSEPPPSSSAPADETPAPAASQDAQAATAEETPESRAAALLEEDRKQRERKAAPPPKPVDMSALLPGREEMMSDQEFERAVRVAMTLLRHLHAWGSVHEAPPDSTDAGRRLQLPDPYSTTQAVLALLSSLTKRHSIALKVLAGKGPKLVLDLPAACFRPELEPSISAIMRHILEDPATLQAAMEAEIRATLSKQKTPANRSGLQNSLPVKQFLQNCAAVISREPKVFLEAVLATCSIKESGGRALVVLRKPKAAAKPSKPAEKDDTAPKDRNGDDNNGPSRGSQAAAPAGGATPGTATASGSAQGNRGGSAGPSNAASLGDRRQSTDRRRSAGAGGNPGDPGGDDPGKGGKTPKDRGDKDPKDPRDPKTPGRSSKKVPASFVEVIDCLVDLVLRFEGPYKKAEEGPSSMETDAPSASMGGASEGPASSNGNATDAAASGGAPAAGSKALHAEDKESAVQCMVLKMLTDFTLMYNACVGVILKRDAEGLGPKGGSPPVTPSVKSGKSVNWAAKSVLFRHVMHTHLPVIPSSGASWQSMSEQTAMFLMAVCIRSAEGRKRIISEIVQTLSPQYDFTSAPASVPPASALASIPFKQKSGFPPPYKVKAFVELAGSLLSAGAPKPVGSPQRAQTQGLSGEMLRSMRFAGVISALIGAMELLDSDHPQAAKSISTLLKPLEILTRPLPAHLRQGVDDPEMTPELERMFRDMRDRAGGADGASGNLPSSDELMQRHQHSASRHPSRPRPTERSGQGYGEEPSESEAGPQAVQAAEQARQALGQGQRPLDAQGILSVESLMNEIIDRAYDEDDEMGGYSGGDSSGSEDEDMDSEDEEVDMGEDPEGDSQSEEIGMADRLDNEMDEGSMDTDEEHDHDDEDDDGHPDHFSDEDDDEDDDDDGGQVEVIFERDEEALDQALDQVLDDYGDPIILEHGPVDGLEDEDNEEEGMEGEYDEEDGEDEEDEDEEGDEQEDFEGLEAIRGQLDPDDVVFEGEEIGLPMWPGLGGDGLADEDAMPAMPRWLNVNLPRMNGAAGAPGIGRIIGAPGAARIGVGDLGGPRQAVEMVMSQLMNNANFNNMHIEMRGDPGFRYRYRNPSPRAQQPAVMPGPPGRHSLLQRPVLEPPVGSSGDGSRGETRLLRPLRPGSSREAQNAWDQAQEYWMMAGGGNGAGRQTISIGPRGIVLPAQNPNADFVADGSRAGGPPGAAGGRPNNWSDNHQAPSTAEAAALAGHLEQSLVDSLRSYAPVYEDDADGGELREPAAAMQEDATAAERHATLTEQAQRLLHEDSPSATDLRMYNMMLTRERTVQAMRDGVSYAEARAIANTEDTARRAAQARNEMPESVPPFRDMMQRLDGAREEMDRLQGQRRSEVVTRMRDTGATPEELARSFGERRTSRPGSAASRPVQEGDAERQRVYDRVAALCQQGQDISISLGGLVSQPGWPVSTARQAMGFFQGMYDVVQQVVDAVDEYLRDAPRPAAEAPSSREAQPQLVNFTQLESNQTRLREVLQRMSASLHRQRQILDTQRGTSAANEARRTPVLMGLFTDMTSDNQAILALLRENTNLLNPHLQRLQATTAQTEAARRRVMEHVTERLRGRHAGEGGEAAARSFEHFMETTFPRGADSSAGPSQGERPPSAGTAQAAGIPGAQPGLVGPSIRPGSAGRPPHLQVPASEPPSGLLTPANAPPQAASAPPHVRGTRNASRHRAVRPPEEHQAGSVADTPYAQVPPLPPWMADLGAGGAAAQLPGSSAAAAPAASPLLGMGPLPADILDRESETRRRVLELLDQAEESNANFVASRQRAERVHAETQAQLARFRAAMQSGQAPANADLLNQAAAATEAQLARHRAVYDGERSRVANAVSQAHAATEAQLARLQAAHGGQHPVDADLVNRATPTAAENLARLRAARHGQRPIGADALNQALGAAMGSSFDPGLATPQHMPPGHQTGASSQPPQASQPPLGNVAERVAGLSGSVPRWASGSLDAPAASSEPAPTPPAQAMPINADLFSSAMSAAMSSIGQQATTHQGANTEMPDATLPQSSIGAFWPPGQGTAQQPGSSSGQAAQQGQQSEPMETSQAPEASAQPMETSQAAPALQQGAAGPSEPESSSGAAAGPSAPPEDEGVEPVDPEFLAALPEELQQEVLESRRREIQQRRNAREREEAQRAAAASGSATETGPAELDLATTIASFPPEVREEVLLGASEDILAQLPPAILAEATRLRERSSARYATMGAVPPAARSRAVPMHARGRGEEAGVPDFRTDDERALQRSGDRLKQELINMAGKALVDERQLLVLISQLRLNSAQAKPQLQRVLFNLSQHHGTLRAVLRLCLTLLRFPLSPDEAEAAMEDDQTSPPRSLQDALQSAEQGGSMGPGQDNVFAQLGLLGRSHKAVPQALTRRILELLTYLAKHQTNMAREMLTLRLPTPEEQVQLIEQEPDIKGKGKRRDGPESSGTLALDVPLELLGKPICKRSSAHLEAALHVIEVTLTSAKVVHDVGGDAEKRILARMRELEEHQSDPTEAMRNVDLPGLERHLLHAVASGGMEASGTSREAQLDFVNEVMADVRAQQQAARASGAPRPAVGDQVDPRFVRDLEDPDENESPIIKSAREQMLKSGSMATLPTLKSVNEDLLKQLPRLLGQKGVSDTACTRAASCVKLVVQCVASFKPLMLKELEAELHGLIQPMLHELEALTAARSGHNATMNVGAGVLGSRILQILEVMASIVVPPPPKKNPHNPYMPQPEPEKEPQEVSPQDLAYLGELAGRTEQLWAALSATIAAVEADVAKTQVNVAEGASGARMLPPGVLQVLPLLKAFFVLCEARTAHLPAPAGAASARRAASLDISRGASMDMPELATQPSTALSVASEKAAAEAHLPFLGFAERHRRLLNMLLHQTPALLEGPLACMMRVPRLIDFDNKRAYFRARIRGERERYSGSLRIHVRREHVFEDSFHQLRAKTPSEMQGKLTVAFHGEEGIDAGGVTREWYQVMAREIFNPNFSLFVPVPMGGSTFQPNPNSVVQNDEARGTNHLDFFKFVGRVVGKALHDGQYIDAYFTRSFYKHMLGQPLTYQDIEAVDPEYYKNLKWMLENDINDVLDLTFTEEVDYFGAVEMVELKPGGSGIKVTNENKREYVDLVAEHRMTTAIRAQTQSFLKGYWEMVPKDLISIFNDSELELLVCGLPEIDTDDLRANTEYTGYSASSPVVQYFWEVVRELDKEDLALLIQFVTGTSKVPLDGFKALQGIGGPQRFQIHKAYGPQARLPAAHTCFNQLDLIEYESKEALKDRLMLALHEGAEGFGFG